MNARLNIYGKLKKFQSNEKLVVKSFENKEEFISSFKNNALLAGAIIYETKEEIENFNKLQLNDSFQYHSSLGVAENGALWCTGLDKERAKLFSCNDLIISISKSSIVSNMHQAYETIDFNTIDYGVFISGPSKTADIEQSLVIGAHGAMGLHIILVD
jgi:L-lactate dehydrogenase complex protein LldG